MKFRKGVLHGDEVTELLNYANEKNFALPAVNCVGTNSVNAALETARDVNSPIIIQFSNGGCVFHAGKGFPVRVRRHVRVFEASVRARVS